MAFVVGEQASEVQRRSFRTDTRNFQIKGCEDVDVLRRPERLTLMQTNSSVEFFINLQIMNSMIVEPIFESFNFKNKFPELNKNPYCIIRISNDTYFISISDPKIDTYKPILSSFSAIAAQSLANRKNVSTRPFAGTMKITLSCLVLEKSISCRS